MQISKQHYAVHNFHKSLVPDNHSQTAENKWESQIASAKLHYFQCLCIKYSYVVQNVIPSRVCLTLL